MNLVNVIINKVVSLVRVTLRDENDNAIGGSASAPIYVSLSSGIVASVSTAVTANIKDTAGNTLSSVATALKTYDTSTLNTTAVSAETKLTSANTLLTSLETKLASLNTSVAFTNVILVASTNAAITLVNTDTTAINTGVASTNVLLGAINVNTGYLVSISTSVGQLASLNTTAALLGSINTSVAQLASISTSAGQLASISTSVAPLTSISSSVAPLTSISSSVGYLASINTSAAYLSSINTSVASINTILTDKSQYVRVTDGTDTLDFFKNANAFSVTTNTFIALGGPAVVGGTAKVIYTTALPSTQATGWTALLCDSIMRAWDGANYSRLLTDSQKNLFVSPAAHVYKNLTASGSVKASAGYLHAITIGTPAAGTISVCNNLSATTVFSSVLVQANQAPQTLFYDVACSTGIYISLSAVMDITVSYS